MRNSTAQTADTRSRLRRGPERAPRSHRPPTRPPPHDHSTAGSRQHESFPQLPERATRPPTAPTRRTPTRRHADSRRRLADTPHADTATRRTPTRGVESPTRRVNRHQIIAQRLQRLRITSIPESTCGGGRKAFRGSVRPALTSQCRNQRPAPGALPSTYLRITALCNTRSAATIREPGASRARRMSLVRPYGGLATTRNGRRGQRSTATSARTTVTPVFANRSLRRKTLPGCSSTATTFAPAASRCLVRAPSPAPTSRTNSPGRTPASATTRAAHSSASGCHPHGPRGRIRAGTTDHHRVVVHDPTLGTRTDPGNRISPHLGTAADGHRPQGFRVVREQLECRLAPPVAGCRVPRFRQFEAVVDHRHGGDRGP
jgi:hypothetical protein